MPANSRTEVISLRIDSDMFWTIRTLGINPNDIFELGFEEKIRKLGEKTPRSIIEYRLREYRNQLEELQNTILLCEKYLQSAPPDKEKEYTVKDEFGEKWTVKESELKTGKYKIIEEVKQ